MLSFRYYYHAFPFAVTHHAKAGFLKLAFRKKQNFKFGSIQLIKESLYFVDYHSNCYNKVTGLSNNYKDNLKTL